MENGGVDLPGADAGSPGPYLLVFDGPAHEQRVHMVVPPSPIRWFCQSAEMGSDERIEWWVIDAAPPEDDSVEITEYRLNPGQVPREEDGDLVIEYTCDDTKWASVEDAPGGDPMGAMQDQLMSDPAFRERLEAAARQFSQGGGVPPEGPGFDRSMFAPKDLRAIKVGSDWVPCPDGAVIRETIIEADPKNPVKLGLGPSFVVPVENGEYLVIPPPDVGGFRFAASTIAGDGLQMDPNEKSVRMSRATYEAMDEQTKKVVETANWVEVIEPDGTQTIEKEPSEGA